MRFISLSLPCAAIVAGCITTEPAMITPQDRVAVIAHRGASAYAPENTLAAFELAAEMEADWYELDCLLTRDNAVIVSHDDSLDRTTNGAGKIAEKTLEELKTLDAGAWFDEKFVGEPMPTLAESLAMARDRIGVYVEIKSADNDGPVMQQLWQAAEGRESLDTELAKEMLRIVEESGSRNFALTRKAIEEIRSAGMTRQVVIQSFSPVICLVSRIEAPEIRTEYLGSYSAEKPAAWDRFLEWGMLIDVAGFNVSYGSLTPERLAWFHERGKSVAVWTVNDPADMRRFIELGVDAIITNHPDTLRDVLAETKRAEDQAAVTAPPAVVAVPVPASA